ncbi:MAG: MMPL family transporter [Treponema sp.]|nr:MMPL family transporter [Treponema sp.]
MKSLTSSLSKLSNKHFLRLWLVYHLGLIAFFLGVLIFKPGKIQIDADLFNMFPRSFQEEGIRNADEKLTEIVGQNIFILVENEEFESAKETATEIYEKLNGSEFFNSVSFYSGLDDISEVIDFLYEYRWNLLTPEQIQMINSEGGELEFAQNALMQAYSPFNMLPLDNLDTDPFMLTEDHVNNFLTSVQNSGTALSVKDNVLAGNVNGKWYVMIRGILNKKGAAVASKANGISMIYETCTPYEKDGTRIIYSGTPFNSHENSNAATKEITIITTISMLVVIIILLLVFKNPVPLLFSVGSILVSILTAVVTTLAVFNKMHILTLVFGTSLIGSCIDYSLHYFTQWAGNPELKSGKEIRNHLLSSLSMAIVSSSLCFAILLFAPFNMLKQMSLFSLSGLLSSFLTTLAVFPFIPLPKKERKINLSFILKESKNKNTKKIVGRIVVSAMFAFSIISILIFYKRIGIHNDVSKLYTMEGRILDDKMLSVEITKYSPTGWFIVRGETEEEALNNEIALCNRLRDVIDQGTGFISTSAFIPTMEQQKASRKAAEKLMTVAYDQYEALGFDGFYADDLISDFEANEKYISLENGSVPDFIMNTINSAWIGKMDDKYYTVVMPNIINDVEQMRSLADENTNVFFVSKIADMGSDLDKLTKMILLFFAGAYIVMFILLRLFYTTKQSLKIISVPFLIILMNAAFFAITKTDMEFFAVTGLILVFGLGLDYIIYMIENEKPKEGSQSKTLEPFATMLSFITTVIGFGALSLSSFQPVHLMGLAIFIGLSTAYLSSWFYDRSM